VLIEIRTFEEEVEPGGGRGLELQGVGEARASASHNPHAQASQITPSASLNILQLVLIQPEIVAQFMDDSQADLFADFGLAGADRSIFF
jgi:hypothetical protein